ncbi:recombinase family protein [Nucisporomicrobium flavum]|uniref:recombinase family protein n=1 Tax=Nucisporomicrobium flavum TaxID=2785915 RepID=UPI0018F6B3D1|nr:recombinase family protein [Nucisporomicrobium flavum]
MLTLLTTAGVASENLFTLWIDRSPERSRGRRRAWRDGGIRFAFYGRISTDGYQDPVSSRRRQLDAAAQLTEQRGCIAVEFFDIGLRLEEITPKNYEAALDPLRTVAEILANPRYTGRQVWNRQRTEHHETVPGDKRTSLGRTRTRNPRSAWVISRESTHPALVSDSEFLTAQRVNSIAVPGTGMVHTYLLTGLLICLLCGRRLEAHWIHGRAGYRCRRGRSSAHPACRLPRSVYWAERRIIDRLLAVLVNACDQPPSTVRDWSN